MRMVMTGLGLLQLCLLLAIFHAEILPTINIIDVGTLNIYLSPIKMRRKIFILEDPISNDEYFIEIENNVRCLKAGTNETLSRNEIKCVCEPNYLGPQCGVPGIIQNATVDGAQVPWSTYTLRSRPRRVISAFPFNHEFDLLEARLYDLHHVVDVFII